MEFTSVNQIKSRFGLEGDNLQELRDVLRQRMLEIHPDRTGGDFQTDEIRQEYLEIDHAVSFIDDEIKRNQQLIPVDQVAALVKAIRDTEHLEPKEAQFEQHIVEFRKDNSRRFIIPKYLAATATGILTFLWTFPSLIADHPVLGDLFDSTSYGNPSLFSLLWVASTAMAALFWGWASIVNNRTKSLALNLSLEYFQNRLFRDFVWREVRWKPDKLIFSKQALVDYIMREAGNRSLFSPVIDIQLAESVATSIISRLIQKGTIRPENTGSLDDVFALIKNPESL